MLAWLAASPSHLHVYSDEKADSQSLSCLGLRFDFLHQQHNLYKAAKTHDKKKISFSNISWILKLYMTTSELKLNPPKKVFEG